MNIFEFAMEKERLSEDYYRKLASKTDKVGLQRIFNMLGDEEVKHQQVVAGMKEGAASEVMETNVLSDAKEVFAGMKKAAEIFDFDLSEAELYKKARDIEKESRAFYLQKADEVKDQRQREIFMKLAEEEKKHYILIDKIIDFVAEPETWLENAEFVHLEDYAGQ